VLASWVTDKVITVLKNQQQKKTQTNPHIKKGHFFLLVEFLPSILFWTCNLLLANPYSVLSLQTGILTFEYAQKPHPSKYPTVSFSTRRASVFVSSFRLRPKSRLLRKSQNPV
jgi:hypothetical protein